MSTEEARALVSSCGQASMMCTDAAGELRRRRQLPADLDCARKQRVAMEALCLPGPPTGGRFKLPSFLVKTEGFVCSLTGNWFPSEIVCMMYCKKGPG